MDKDYGSVDGGLLVTVTGTDFEGCWLSVDGEVVNQINGSPFQFFTPVHEEAGVVNIRVRKVMAAGKFDEEDFAYLNNPSITSCSPGSGTMAGGTTVEINGSNLVQGKIPTVKFGDGVAIVQGQPGDNKITVTTPPHIIGEVPVEVDLGNGVKGSKIDAYEYINIPPQQGPPTISDVVPKQGNVGTQVIIIGTNFASPNVTFGSATAQVVNSSSSFIFVNAPQNDVGTVDVKVINDNGDGESVTKEDAFTYLSYDVLDDDYPIITNINPNTGAPEDTVIITGANLSEGLEPIVLFGVTTNTTNYISLATVTSYTEDSVVVTVPSNPTTQNTVNITLLRADDGKSAFSPTFFTYIIPTADMYISGINPSQGIAGDTVTISGVNLSMGSKPEVSFMVTTATTIDLALATVTSYNNQTVVVTVPSNPSTQNIVDVFVKRTTDNEVVKSPTPFTYIVPTQDPLITSINPVTGNVGDTVVISGVNLSNGFEPEVYFGVTANVTTGSAKAVVTNHSDQIVVVKVPSQPSLQDSVDVFLKRNDSKIAKSPTKFTYTEEIKILGNLDVQKVVIDGTPIRNNDYIKKALTSVVIHIAFNSSATPSSGNATITIGSESISASFNVPTTVNNTLVSTATLASVGLSAFSNALEEGKNDFAVTAVSDLGATANVADYSIYVAADGDEVKLMPLPDGNLLLNYPNPFNPNGGESTAIAFALNKEATISIYIYDLKGTLIVNRDISASEGYNTYIWDGGSDFGDICGTGTYFYRMAADEIKVLGTGKLTIINK